MDEINFCSRCGKRTTALGVHTCSPQSTVTANDQLRARVAELEAEVSRLKTVPMKYRRMQFNAELQEQVFKLEAQLAEKNSEAQSANSRLHEVSMHCVTVEMQLAETEALEIAHGERIEKLTKLLLLAKEALSQIAVYEHPDLSIGAEALDAINDSNVEGLILCDAEPVASCDTGGRLRFDSNLEVRYGNCPSWIGVGTKLYTPRSTK